MCNSDFCEWWISEICILFKALIAKLRYLADQANNQAAEECTTFQFLLQAIYTLEIAVATPFQPHTSQSKYYNCFVGQNNLSNHLWDINQTMIIKIFKMLEISNML